MKFIYTFSLILVLFEPFLGTNAVQQIRSSSTGGNNEAIQIKTNLNQQGTPNPEQEGTAQQENDGERTAEGESDDQLNKTNAEEAQLGGESVNPECIGEILKPIRLEMTKYINYGLGERVEGDQHIISKSSQIGDHFDMFLVIEFELNAAQAEYIKLLSPNFEASLRVKMAVIYSDYGYACPRHIAYVGDSSELSEDKFIEKDMTFIQGGLSQDNFFVVDIKDLLVHKLEKNENLLSKSLVDERDGHFLNLILKPDARCVFDISVDENKPVLEIRPLKTTYVEQNDWKPCTERCKSKNAYQCAPVKCFERSEPCKIESMYKKRPCKDVPDCNNWNDWFSVVGLTKLTYIGLGVLGVILILGGVYFFLRRNRNPRYVQIEGGDAAGSIYAGD